MISNAQFEFPPPEPRPLPPHAPSPLKREVAERLAAHRNRRPHTHNETAAHATSSRPADIRTNIIAASVAARYANTTSYRDYLAAEAEAALQQAEAIAEVANRNVEAIAAVQQSLLAELNQNPDQPAIAESAPSSVSVRPKQQQRISRTQEHTEPPAAYSFAFEPTPVPEAPYEEPIQLPANLIEFPRMLVAPHKARARLAEGPLRDSSSDADSQLRIFEVGEVGEAAPEAIQSQAAIEMSAPVWTSIRLDDLDDPEASPASLMAAQLHPQATFALPPQTATLEHRIMAALVNASIIGTAFFAFIFVFAISGAALPTGKLALIGAAGVLFALFVIYQLLFFTLSYATPGMRYARIGLCTFSDENPTRAAMRLRIIAVLLAACPAALGFLWSLVDDDRLGWHDRICHMYQRSY